MGVPRGFEGHVMGLSTPLQHMWNTLQMTGNVFKMTKWVWTSPFFECSNMCSGGGETWRKAPGKLQHGCHRPGGSRGSLQARLLRRYLMWGLVFPPAASEPGVQVWKLLPGTGNLRSIPGIKHLETGQEGRRPIGCAHAPSLIYRLALDRLCNNQSESLLLLQVPPRGAAWWQTQRE